MRSSMAMSLDAGLGQPDRRTEAGEAGTDDQRRVGVLGGHDHAAGWWVSSLNQLGTGLSSGLG